MVTHDDFGGHMQAYSLLAWHVVFCEGILYVATGFEYILCLRGYSSPNVGAMWSTSTSKKKSLGCLFKITLKEALSDSSG